MTRHSSCSWPDECVDEMPDIVNVRHLVSDELRDIKTNGYSQHYGMTEYLKGRRKTQHAEMLQQTKNRDRCVQIETGCKSGAKYEKAKFCNASKLPSQMNAELRQVSGVCSQAKDLLFLFLLFGEISSPAGSE